MTKTAQDFAATKAVRRGTTTTVRIPIVDAAGAPINLTNYQGVWWGVWKTAGKAEDWASALITKTKADGDITFANYSGTKDAIVFEVDEDDLSPSNMIGKYYHEAKGQDASGKLQVWSCGEFHVLPSPTRDREV